MAYWRNCTSDHIFISNLHDYFEENNKMEIRDKGMDSNSIERIHYSMCIWIVGETMNAREIEYNIKQEEYWREVRKPKVLREVKSKLEAFCETLTEEELRVIDEDGLVNY